jgi:hypothetical protein
MITHQLASQVIIDILNTEMNMPPNSVWLRDQNKTIPNTNGMFIAVGLVNASTMANITEIQTYDANGKIIPNSQPGTAYEVNQVQQQEAIQIDILSSAANNYAMLRNWEVIAALQSLYSQQLQEQNNFKIFRIPRSFVDTSSAEGGSILQRYSITIVCHVWYRKQKLLGTYYDDFNVAVTTETANPAFEFEVTKDTPPPPYP